MNSGENFSVAVRRGGYHRPRLSGDPVSAMVMELPAVKLPCRLTCQCRVGMVMGTRPWIGPASSVSRSSSGLRLVIRRDVPVVGRIL